MKQPGEGRCLLFTGSKSKALAEKVALDPQISLGKGVVKSFVDQEIRVQIQEEVFDQKVFVIQTVSVDPNRSLLEFLFLVEALKQEKVKEIVGIIPYLAYTRQDKKKEGELLAIKYIAKLLKQSGISSLITIEMHSRRGEEFFEVPLFTLEASELFLEKLKKRRWQNPVLCSPDEGGRERGECLAKQLGWRFFCLQKQRNSEQGVKILSFEEEVKDKELVIVDDIASTGATLEEVAKEGKKRGASKVVALVTHLLPSAKFPSVDLVFSTDTVEEEGLVKRELISVAPLLQKRMKNCIT